MVTCGVLLQQSSTSSTNFLANARRKQFSALVLIRSYQYLMIFDECLIEVEGSGLDAGCAAAARRSGATGRSIRNKASQTVDATRLLSFQASTKVSGSTAELSFSIFGAPRLERCPLSRCGALAPLCLHSEALKGELPAALQRAGDLDGFGMLFKAGMSSMD